MLSSGLTFRDLAEYSLEPDKDQAPIPQYYNHHDHRDLRAACLLHKDLRTCAGRLSHLISEMDAAATAPLSSALEQNTEALRQHSSRLPEVRASVVSLMAAIDELNGNCTRTDLLTSRIMGLRSGMEKVRPQRGSRENLSAALEPV